MYVLSSIIISRGYIDEESEKSDRVVYNALSAKLQRSIPDKTNPHDFT